MKKIVLVIPPQEKFTKDYLPSLGLGYIASCLERANYKVKIIDSHINNFDDEQTINKVLEEKPDAIGVTATSHNRFHAISVCKGIKKKSNNQAFISVGGCHFSPTAISLLEAVPEIDVVVIGEGERTYVDLLNHYFENKSLENVLGIVFKKHGKIISTLPRPFVKNLDELPRPAWHLFDLEKYNAKLEGEDETKSIGVMSSRGCPNSCCFCVNSAFWKRIFRRHSPKRFVDDVEFLHKKYGYTGFDFWDDTMTTVKDHIEGICEEILKRNLNIVWYARARVNTVDREMLTLMRKAGCKVIGFGVESGSIRILKNIKKHITIEQVKEIVKICVDLDYIIKLFFIYNLPGETLEDIKATRNLMRELKFFGPNVHVLPGYGLIYPGTEMEKIARQENCLEHNFNWNKPVKFIINEKFGVNPIIPLYQQKQLKSEDIKIYLESQSAQRMELIKSIPLAIKAMMNPKSFKYFLEKGINYVKKNTFKFEPKSKLKLKYMESIKELRKICQEKGFQEHMTLRFHRIFSIYITKIFLILKIKPNTVTVTGFLMGVIGGYLFLNSYFLQGSAFFLVFLIFDYVDGEIARYRKLSSNFGAWLDTISVHLLYPYFFFTLGLGIFFQTGIFWYAILGAIAAMAKLIERSMVQPLIKSNNLKFLKNQTITSVKEWANHIGKVSVQYPVIFLCSLVGWEKQFLWFFAIYLTLFTSGKVFLTGWRTYKQIKYYRDTK